MPTTQLNRRRIGGPLRDGNSLLIAGASRDTLSGVLRALVDSRPGEAGGVLVTTQDAALDIRPSSGPLDAFESDRAAVIDCTPGQGPTSEDRDALEWRVSSPVDFTGIGIAVSRCLDELDDRGVSTPWLVFDSLSTQLVSSDSAVVVRFAHALTTQVAARRGIGLFPVSTNVTTGTDFERLKHLSDGLLAVEKRAESRRLRWHGVSDAPDEWFAFPERRDAGETGTGLS